jgi:hypothetical protein
MKKTMTALIGCACVALLFFACGKSKETSAGGAAAASQSAAAPAAVPERTGMKKIGDMADAWTALYNQNEAAINSYEGMPIMGLVTPPLALAMATQFDMMNIDERDGRFEGKMMLAGYKGFVERSGSLLTFGYDDTLQKDGFGPAHKAGTRVKGGGSLDLAKEYFIWHTHNEQEGKEVDRDFTQFKRLADGSMICLAMNGRLFNMRGDADPADSVIYLHNGPGRYDFVIAKGKNGPGFTPISFAEQGDLTQAQAVELIKAAGYVIEHSGRIQGGKLVLDE